MRGVEAAADAGPERRVRDGELERGLAVVRAADDREAIEREGARGGDEAAADVDPERAGDAEVGRAREVEAEARAEAAVDRERRPVERRRRDAAGRAVHLDAEARHVGGDAGDADERRGGDLEQDAGVCRRAVRDRAEREVDARKP